MSVAADNEERAELLVGAGVDVIVVDTAHGHSQGVLDRVAWVKKRFPNVQVIGGNVATAAGAQALVDHGADAVKVGIGPGSICTTRIVAGVGVPQITAIQMRARRRREGERADHRRRRHPLFGRHREGDRGRRVVRHARQPVRRHRRIARRDRALPGPLVQELPRHGLARRDAAGQLGPLFPGPRGEDPIAAAEKLVPEGIEGRVPYKGALRERDPPADGRAARGDGLLRLRARSRSCRTRAEFVEITSAGIRESHVHDVQIVKEAPNYRVE